MATDSDSDLELDSTPDPKAPPDLVRLYTDGACSGNPGPGGWAYIMKHPSSGQVRDDSGSAVHTTNNRMELLSVIEGLASLKRPCKVEVVTDSQYVAKGITEWMSKWKTNQWQRKENGRFKPVINVDLWQRLDVLVANHEVRVSHVLGHRGHPENEACDRMAVAAIKALKADMRG